MHFALYGRKFGPDAEGRIRTLLEHLARKGVRVTCCSALASCIRERGLDGGADIGEFSGPEDLPGDVDIFLSLGGDGTFLSALTIVGDSGIPVAGINFPDGIGASFPMDLSDDCSVPVFSRHAILPGHLATGFLADIGRSSLVHDFLVLFC